MTEILNRKDENKVDLFGRGSGTLQDIGKFGGWHHIMSAKVWEGLGCLDWSSI
jgi:hypothetical protein